jgi:uncharacterized membrane protein YqjE
MTIKQTLASAASDLTAMIRTRIALFGLELSIETSRLLGLLALACASLVFGLLAVLIFSFFVVAFFWDTPHRMLAIGLLGSFYVIAAALFMTVLCRRIKNSEMPFQATLQELERDAHMFARFKQRALGDRTDDHDANQKDGW